jgi:hypothetical protein
MVDIDAWIATTSPTPSNTMTKRDQLALSFATISSIVARSADWARFEAAMLAAEAACLAFANALEVYLRKGGNEVAHNPAFQATCAAADACGAAILAAEEFHFASIPYCSGSLVYNLDTADLLALMRELRGSAIPVSTTAGSRTRSSIEYAEDGMAGFYRCELRSMRPFGTPRKRPGEV